MKRPLITGDRGIAALVAVGVALAGFLAWAATVAVPAADTLIPTVGVASPVGAADIGGGNAIGELERGRVYYAQVCMPCHGARGDGQGEWAYRVTPRPADLTGQRTQGRSDRELYRIIGDGLPATAMTGWKRRLSDRQLWQLVAYLRHLGGSGA